MLILFQRLLMCDSNFGYFDGKGTISRASAANVKPFLLKNGHDEGVAMVCPAWVFVGVHGIPTVVGLYVSVTPRQPPLMRRFDLLPLSARGAM